MHVSYACTSLIAISVPQGLVVCVCVCASRNFSVANLCESTDTHGETRAFYKNPLHARLVDPRSLIQSRVIPEWLAAQARVIFTDLSGPEVKEVVHTDVFHV